MELKNFEKFNGLLGDLLWYPKAFLLSEAGMRWNKVPSRRYYSTPWMEFFSELKNDTLGKLSEDICGEQYTRYFRTEIEVQLNHVLKELRDMEISAGIKKIPVNIETDKFRRYEENLKRMSSEKIIFDIIQDAEDIRETYFIDADPAKIRSYMLLTLQWVLDNFVSAEKKKNRELKNRVHELENELREKNSLLAMAKDRQKDLEERDERTRKELDVRRKEIEELEESLARFKDDELSVEPDNNNIRENSKLRMYYVHKLGFLDDSIWNEDIPQKVRAQIIGMILDAGPLKSDTAIRYYKFFNSTGSSELKEYDTKNEHIFFDYMRKNCPNLKFEKGGFINRLRKI